MSFDIYCALLDKEKEDREKERRRHIFVLIITVVAFIIMIVIGTIFYAWLFGLGWLDAFYHAALTLAAISLEVEAMTVGQKIFIVVYSLVSVLMLISLANTATLRLFDLIWPAET